MALEHFPILMSGYERYLFDRKPGFEQSARAFVAQVMKMKITKCLHPCYAGCGWRLAAVNLALRFQRLPACIALAQKRLADVASFPAYLDPP